MAIREQPDWFKWLHNNLDGMDLDDWLQTIYDLPVSLLDSYNLWQQGKKLKLTEQDRNYLVDLSRPPPPHQIPPSGGQSNTEFLKLMNHTDSLIELV